MIDFVSSKNLFRSSSFIWQMVDSSLFSNYSMITGMLIFGVWYEINVNREYTITMNNFTRKDWRIVSLFNVEIWACIFECVLITAHLSAFLRYSKRFLSDLKHLWNRRAWNTRLLYIMATPLYSENKAKMASHQKEQLLTKEKEMKILSTWRKFQNRNGGKFELQESMIILVAWGET